MAVFRLLSTYGDSLFLARRLAREGHQVAMHIRHPPARHVGEGLVSRLLTPVVPPGAVVLFDDVGRGDEGMRWRKAHHGVIGGNPFDHDLEIDRRRGTLLMEAAGIAVPETHTFTDLAAAKAFLATHDGHWFFKPSGNHPTWTTCDGEAAQLREWLSWAGKHLQGIRTFCLQERVQGTEVSLEGWFDGEQWVPPFNSTVEDKKFLVGNLGPRTGCQSNVVWAWKDDRPPLAEQTLLRMTGVLKAARYVDPVDLNMIVDGDGTPHGLEWSARFGFDALQALCCLIRGDLGDQLARFAAGKLDRFAVRQDAVALTLRVTIPPFPSDAPEGAPDERGLPLDRRVVDPTYPFLADDIMLGSNGPVCAGRDGSLGVLWAVGANVRQLRDTVLRHAKELAIPQKQYRVDPVLRAEATWKALGVLGDLAAGDVPRESRRSAARPSTAGRDDTANTPGNEPGPPPFVSDPTDASY